MTNKMHKIDHLSRRTLLRGAGVAMVLPWLESIPATVVVDHFGRVDPHLGVDQEPFGLLCVLMKKKNYWTKISGADRLTRQGPPYDDVAPFARRLADIAPDRLLWGSDWPHTGVFDAAKMPDDGKLLDALHGFLPESVVKKILVENPGKLLNAP